MPTSSQAQILSVVDYQLQQPTSAGDVNNVLTSTGNPTLTDNNLNNRQRRQGSFTDTNIYDSQTAKVHDASPSPKEKRRHHRQRSSGNDEHLGSARLQPNNDSNNLRKQSYDENQLPNDKAGTKRRGSKTE
ncbi:unnamed protein product, partial [Didymodactylos carnosus]